jgi:hypothetical protein
LERQAETRSLLRLERIVAPRESQTATRRHRRIIQRKLTAEMPADIALPSQPPAEADLHQLPKAMNALNADKFRWFQA